MRFISPAVSGMTTERKAIISSRELNPTTTAIVTIRRLDISSARST
jgi:hypothetical protein